MAVITHLSQEDIVAVLAPRGYRLLDATPASEGIENSNYLLRCERDDGAPIGLVLTLLEHQTSEAARWFAEMLDRFREQGLPVPAPVCAPFPLHDRPALLAPWLPGEHILIPQARHCRQIGRFLAGLHRVPAPPQPPQSERDTLHELARHLPRLPEAWQPRAAEVLARWDAVPARPGSLLHADLFRDNALFLDGQLSGVLDFYHACVDRPAYDVAVALNDWCVNSDGTPDAVRAEALLEGYGAFAQEEKEVLPLALAVAALRFWLSRAGAEGPARKDPEEFARVFAHRWQELGNL